MYRPWLLAERPSLRAEWGHCRWVLFKRKGSAAGLKRSSNEGLELQSSVQSYGGVSLWRIEPPEGRSRMQLTSGPYAT